MTGMTRTREKYWAIDAGELDLWHKEAVEVVAYSMEHAAETFAFDSDSGIDGDDDEMDVVVADDEIGTNARRFTVSVEVIREYTVMDSDDEVDIPRRPGDEDVPVVLVDTQNLPLFDE